ncbi:HNH endonuclease [Rhizobium sp. CFBP 13726]|uniref:HNH endonuclease n=1 Tax=Rhizobium sp. CFBP 13726 TaxID=2775296 RepID=UPI0017856C43|nr:HNH endonuclease [Rhizobium sp. CFBP 13726]MBD8650996.1 HNH endonuclease [Rhizobium sp. CFBP 13726]
MQTLRPDNFIWVISMTTYLLKLNCKIHLGGANPRPKAASEWEGASVRFPNPRMIAGGAGRPVQKGDTLIVWTHEAPGFGLGAGLTAEGVAGEVIKGDAETTAVLTNVRLLSPHYQLRGWQGGSSGSSVIDHILSHRHLRSYELETAELEEFRRIVLEFMAKRQKLLATTEYMSDEQKALLFDEPGVLAGFERRFGSQELRPEQALFRHALIKRYNGRCPVSRCSVGAVLQAAHIIPFSENVALRNDIRNGLLLRADIHVLFDKLLLAIHPKTGMVEIAPELLDSSYKQFQGRKIEHYASPVFLKEQHQLFLASQKEPRSD